MRSQTRFSRRSVITRGLLFGLAGGALSFAGGCGGEKEVPILPSGKSKDELQKDIENPYGAPPPKQSGKGKGGR